MSQSRQFRWYWDRLEKYVPDWYDGRYWAPRRGGRPPYFNEVQRTAAANVLMAGLFAGVPNQKIRDRFDRLALSHALRPFQVERVSHGRGQLQSMLFTSSCPMWCSAWEPRVIWQGRYDPTKGVATIIVEPGPASLRFKGESWVRPLSISLNGKSAPYRDTLKLARSSGGWHYRADRRTIYVISNERDRIEMKIRFKPDPDAPKPRPRMVSTKPVDSVETNMLNNASFDIPHRSIAKAPFVGAVTGPYLYVNYWFAPDRGDDRTSPLLEGFMRLNGKTTRTAGVSLEMYSGKDTQVRQNVPAKPGPHRMSLWARLGGLEWQPDESEFRVSVVTMNADIGEIETLTESILIVTPSGLADDAFVPIILELDAPAKTNAIQVTVSFKPKSGEGDISRRRTRF